MIEFRHDTNSALTKCPPAFQLRSLKLSFQVHQLSLDPSGVEQEDPALGEKGKSVTREMPCRDPDLGGSADGSTLDRAK